MDDDLNIKNPYLKGAKEMYENGVLVSVDVDFLVYAHICVYEDVSSYGRYLCFNHIINTINDAINLANNFNISPLPSPPPRYIYMSLIFPLPKNTIFCFVLFYVTIFD